MSACSCPSDLKSISFSSNTISSKSRLRRPKIGSSIVLTLGLTPHSEIRIKFCANDQQFHVCGWFDVTFCKVFVELFFESGQAPSKNTDNDCVTLFPSRINRLGAGFTCSVSTGKNGYFLPCRSYADVLYTYRTVLSSWFRKWSQKVVLTTWFEVTSRFSGKKQ